MYVDNGNLRGKGIRIPNYFVDVRPHELLVMNTPTFQRLFGIKQLGLAYMVYPYATHTRGAHSLDCLYWAQMIVDSLVNNGFLDEAKNSEEIEIIRFSALLHDIMHIPQGHTLEDEAGILQRHDKSQRIDVMLARIDKEIPKVEGHAALALGVPRKQDYDKARRLLKDVKKVLWTIALYDETNTKGKPLLENDRYYMADIIGNTMCADLLAYIEKDVDYTGIEKKSGGYTIFHHMELAKDRMGRTRLAIRLTKAGVRPDAISAIQSILEVRYALTEQVIYHHAKCAASAMLAKIASLCGITESDELYEIGDEGFMSLLKRKIAGLPERLQDGRPLQEAAANLLQNLKSRRLYKRVFRVTPSERREYDKTHEISLATKYGNPKARAEVENYIEETFGFEPGSIILFCPMPKAALKEARAMVVYDKVKDIMSNESVQPVAVELRGDDLAEDYPEISERVRNLEKQYLSLWSLYGFLDPEKFGYAAAVKNLLQEKLEVHSDPLLELYLNEKPEYRQSKQIEQAQAKAGEDARARIYRGVLEKVARGDVSSLDDDTLKRIVDAAYHQRHESNTKPPQLTKGTASERKELPFS